VKYFRIACAYWQSSFVSPEEVIISLLRPLVVMFIQFVLFNYIYRHAYSIGGFTFEEIITYVFISGFVFSFVDNSRLAYEMENLTLSGRFVNFYVLPVSFYFYMFFKYIGENLARSIPLIFVGIVLGLSGIIKISVFKLPMFFLLVLSGFALSFAIYFLIGTLVFKVIKITGLVDLFRFFFDVLSGRLFPLSFLPALIAKVAVFSPFALSIYLPIKFLMGKMISGSEYYALIFILVFCTVLSMSIFKRIVKEYEGMGG